MSPEEYVTNIVLNLGEVETLELLRIIDSPNDPPPFHKGEFTPLEVEKWVARNMDIVVPCVLRVVDLGDEAIAYMSRLGVFSVGTVSWEGTLQVTFTMLSRATVDSELHYSDREMIGLTDLAATSAALCELLVEIAAANHPLGVSLNPPIVRVRRGSIQYSVGGGGLLASGIALIVACSDSLLAIPTFGYVGGGVLASAGILDLAFGWRRVIAESVKLRAETRKLKAEALKLEAEARKIEAEARMIETQAQQEGTYEYMSGANSALVPREVVLIEAEKLGLTESYTNHILNRTLPKYASIRQRFQNIHVEKMRDEESEV